MKSSLPLEQIVDYLQALLLLHFPDGSVTKIKKVFSDTALSRLEYCFTRINMKYYNINNSLVFNHLNSDHMTSLIYFFANTLSVDANERVLATKLSYLNKILHGVDIFYHVRLPKVFILSHPIGSVIGRADLKNFLYLGQHVTIGGKSSAYPKIGEGVILHAGSVVIGNCLVGDNVTFGANSFIIDTIIPSDSVVVGQFPNHRILVNKHINKSKYFFTQQGDA